MAGEMEARYTQRLNRYVTTLRNGRADRVPLRPFVAEFAAKYAGYNCQQVTHDYQMAFAAARKCAADFDWDAVVGNMVYVWTGLTQAIGLKYYATPGIEIPAQTGFQYREPREQNAFMCEDEYDALTADPTGFLLNTWLPRVSHDVVAPGETNTMRNNLSFLKGGMAMLSYFMDFGKQAGLLRTECGMPGAIAGILKAPFDILADKLRGYVGLSMDVLEQPDKVKAACEALAPHLCHIALGGADPEKKLPISIWMHRGCVPFISMKHFEEIYWPTLKPIILEIFRQGHQVLFYAEGKWEPHLERFNELPAGSIIYHCDRDDLAEVKRVLGKKFCISGGLSNVKLAMSTPDEVRDECKRIIDLMAPDGGYVFDASAIVQNDALVENVRAMTEAVREFGKYPSASEPPKAEPAPKEAPAWCETARAPGSCIPWSEKLKELPPIQGDTELVKRIWENVDALAHLYAWHCLVSF
jgi:hypothetical protein